MQQDEAGRQSSAVVNFPLASLTMLLMVGFWGREGNTVRTAFAVMFGYREREGVVYAFLGVGDARMLAWKKR